MPHFYDESLETLPLSEIKERQLNLLKQQFARAIQTPFYAQMIRNTGIDEIKTIADITRILTHPCSCGRTHRRIAPIKGRTDDMFIINGVNIFPSQIEEAILAIIPPPLNWIVYIKEENGRKKLLLTIEVEKRFLSDNSLLKSLSDILQSFITVKPYISFVSVGTLPKTTGKTKHIIQLK